MLLSVYKHGHMWADVEEDKIWESSGVKLIGIKIGN